MSRELYHFLLLTVSEQAEAIKRMASQGWSEYGLAQATRLSVEQIRRILSERAEVIVGESPTIAEPRA